MCGDGDGAVAVLMCLTCHIFDLALRTPIFLLYAHSKAIIYHKIIFFKIYFFSKIQNLWRMGRRL